jgi:transposase, IS5 family
VNGYFLVNRKECRYKGDAGIQRWVGLGVIADNLVNIGRAMKKRAAT